MITDDVPHIRMALDLLSVALAEHNHAWTEQERSAFDRANVLLSQYANTVKVDAEREMVRAFRHDNPVPPLTNEQRTVLREHLLKQRDGINRTLETL